jgi:PAS domain-containing protein
MSSETIKILFIEKNSADVERLQHALQGASQGEFELVHAANLEEAARCLDDVTIDILVVDLQFLDKYGMDTLAQMRTTIPAIPILVLTETDSEARTMRAIQSGVQDYLVRHELGSDRLIWKLRYAIEHQMRIVAQQHIQELQASETRFNRVIMHNADGIIVVDQSGTVQMVNPAAELLLGRTAAELMGQDFGFPLVAGETTELDILRPGRNAAVAEMRVVEIEWDDALVFLTSLRDITPHRHLEDALREAEQFSRHILNSITAAIVVLNHEGSIITMNDAWVELLKAQGEGDTLLECSTIGSSYLELWQRAIGPFPASASAEALEGLHTVLAGEREVFVLEYPTRTADDDCPDDAEATCWLVMRVMPLMSDQHAGVVISHTDITERKRAARIAAEAEEQAARVAQLEHELQTMLQISSNGPSAITSTMFGKEPLNTQAPDLFQGLVQRYGELLDLALEQRAYKIEYNLSYELRLMARQLGFLKAGPRDVVEIHSVVLQHKSEQYNPLKNQAYLEEGRLLVLELMGYLASYYRSYALGTHTVM